MVWEGFEYKPQTFEYSGAGSQLPYASTLAQEVIPSLPSEFQYGLAARELYPTFQDQPRLSSMMAGLQDPIMGRYNLQNPFGADVSSYYNITPEQNLAKYTAGILRQPGGYDPSTWGLGGDTAAQQTQKTMYQDLINTLRQSRLGYEGVPSDRIYDIWAPYIGDKERLESISSLIDAKPYARGSMAGDMYARSQQRQKERFLWENPGASEGDWLVARTRRGTPEAENQWSRGVSDHWLVDPMTAEQKSRLPFIEEAAEASNREQQNLAALMSQEQDLNNPASNRVVHRDNQVTSTGGSVPTLVEQSPDYMRNIISPTIPTQPGFRPVPDTPGERRSVLEQDLLDSEYGVGGSKVDNPLGLIYGPKGEKKSFTGFTKDQNVAAIKSLYGDETGMYEKGKADRMSGVREATGMEDQLAIDLDPTQSTLPKEGDEGAIAGSILGAKGKKLWEEKFGAGATAGRNQSRDQARIKGDPTLSFSTVEEGVNKLGVETWVQRMMDESGLLFEDFPFEVREYLLGMGYTD